MEGVGSRGLIAGVGSFAHDMMKGVKSELGQIQQGPPGTVPRGARERNSLWNRMNSLDKPSLQVMMESMANQANHTPDEAKMCELCRFLSEHL